MPTLWECAKDIKSPRDLWEFLPLLVPMPIYRAWRAVRHPVGAFFLHRQRQWVRSVKPGDVICFHGEHVIVIAVNEFDFAETVAGNADLWNCCDAVQPDGRCHDGLHP
jgi:hypothetical protein